MSGMTAERAKELERKMARTAKLAGDLFDETKSDMDDLRAMVETAVSAQNAYVHEAIKRQDKRVESVGMRLDDFRRMGFADRLRWLFLGAR